MKRTLILLSLLTMALAKVAHAEPASGTIWKEPKTGMEFAWIPGSCFQMGSYEESPIHEVCLKGFWMGRTEVTQAQYQQIMGKDPSSFSGANNPVENVNVEDADNFIKEIRSSIGTNLSLPTEAQWEYACRAGSTRNEYCGLGDRSHPPYYWVVSSLAWHDNNSGFHTHAVAQLAPNDWGLYDMSGNVWEWTQDCWNSGYEEAPADGSAWKTGDCSRHVLRGGSWFNAEWSVRAAVRSLDSTAIRVGNIGFRLVRTLP